MIWLYSMIAVTLLAMMWFPSATGRGLIWPVVVGFVCWFLMMNIRCPRCRVHITGYRYGTFWPWEPLTQGDPCPVCGRTRKTVWPFEYLFGRHEHQQWREREN